MLNNRNGWYANRITFRKRYELYSPPSAAANKQMLFKSNKFVQAIEYINPHHPAQDAIVVDLPKIYIYSLYGYGQVNEEMEATVEIEKES